MVAAEFLERLNIRVQVLKVEVITAICL